MHEPEDIPQKIIRSLLPKPAAKVVDRWYKWHAADYVVVSYPKSGRTWLRVMLSCYFKVHYQLPKLAVLEFANLHQQDARVPKIFLTHDDSFKTSPENLKRHKRWYRRRKVIYLVRDPRDVIVSLYFHRTRRNKDHPGGSLADFVFAHDGGIETLIEFNNIWASEFQNMHDLLLIKYEDMQQDPENTLRSILQFLGVEPMQEALRAAIEESSFDRMRQMESKNVFGSGRMRSKDPGDNNANKVRRGKIGGYVEYFDPDQLAQIDAIVCSDLAPIFGYSSDSTRYS